jgi:hypothetical protein
MRAFAILAVLVVVTVAVVLLIPQRDADRRDEASLRIYRCVVERIYEDGSADTADAEDASACMRAAGVWDEFIADYR